MNKRSRLIAAVMAAWLATVPWSAATAGSIQLLVTDKEGKPVPDVVVLVASAQKTAAAAPAAPVVIAQQELRFVPFLSVVAQGSTLRFVNRDGYDHHVRSTPSGPLGNAPPVTSFEFRLDAGEAAPSSPNDEYKSPAAARKKTGATTAEVKLDKPGPIGLGCHIHASMRGQVYVSATPWFGKTDANGALVIDGVPDGAAEVTLWHPDQLQDQPPLQVQVAPGTPAKSTAQLNFTPRRRRS
jgi:plastocyanin